MDGSFGAPDKWYDLLIVPGLAVFFGLLIRFLGWNREKMGKPSTTWSWFAIAVLALGAFVGFKAMWNLFDPDLAAFYRATIWQRRVLVSHYLAFGLPFIALLIVIGWNMTEKRLGRPIAI
ncbi:MAG: hypothetical protein ACAH95_08990 [Fimbriimonas sp.]